MRNVDRIFSGSVRVRKYLLHPGTDRKIILKGISKSVKV
jgi:hypothetical protein